MIQKVKKIVFRMFRILTLKKGIYCDINGRGNKFTNSVFIEEGAKIGKQNYFGPYTMINNAIIGNYCSFAPNVKIGQGKHSIDNVTTYQTISSQVIGHRLNTKPSILGSDIWCGANVVIMQDIKIGNGAVIGANSVVTKDVPDYAIVAGSPAKILRYRHSKETIDLLLKSKWYDLDLEQAIIKVAEMENIIANKGVK